jgi:hypothetical protein
MRATIHAWQASLLAQDGRREEADAELGHGLRLAREAVAVGELDAATADGLAWVMGQPVAEVEIDAGRPEVALEQLDTLRSGFGEPPPSWRPHSDLARLAAEAGMGRLRADQIQTRTGEIAGRFGESTAPRAWRAGATHLLAVSHLLAAGERRRAQVSLQLAEWPVRVGTRDYKKQPEYGLRPLLEWGRQAASPGPDTRREMTAIMKELDDIGAAAEAKRVDDWLREGRSDPPSPPISMAFLRHERNAHPAEWVGGGD